MKNGYYWARLPSTDEWEVVEVHDDCVWRIGNERQYRTSDFEFTQQPITKGD